MTYPTTTFLGLTQVGWLNFLLLQWLFIRLQGRIDTGPGFGSHTEWEIISPVVPLTGWWSSYLPRRPRARSMREFFRPRITPWTIVLFAAAFLGRRGLWLLVPYAVESAIWLLWYRRRARVAR